MPNLMRTLKEQTSKMFGWESEYFFTETDEKIGIYNTKRVVNNSKIKVLIPEKFDSQLECRVIILKSEFINGKSPSIGDILKLRDRMYSVGYIEDKDDVYELDLSKYEDLYKI